MPLGRFALRRLPARVARRPGPRFLARHAHLRDDDAIGRRFRHRAEGVAGAPSVGVLRLRDGATPCDQAARPATQTATRTLVALGGIVGAGAFACVGLGLVRPSARTGRSDSGESLSWECVKTTSNVSSRAPVAGASKNPADGDIIAE